MSEPSSDALQTAMSVAVFALPALGIVVVLFSLVALIFPFGARLRDKTQRFKGLGIELEMSSLTLVLLLGVVLCFSSIYVVSQSYESRLAELSAYPGRLESQERVYRQALADAQRLTIGALIDLEGISGKGENVPSGLSCETVGFPSREATTRTVGTGPKTNQFKVALENVSPTTFFERLRCSDKTGRRWFVEYVSPLSPEYHLKQER
jgi:hypothetical protein